MGRGLVAKAFALGMLIAGLMLVIGMIREVVLDRQANKRVAVQSIYNSWGGEQTLTGPWIERRCEARWRRVSKGPKGETISTKQAEIRFNRQLATKSQSTAKLDVSQRTRGIFSANAYVLNQASTLTFAAPKPLEFEADAQDTSENCAAYAIFGVSDPRGLRSANLEISGEKLSFKPGMPSGFEHLKHQGAHVLLPALARGERVELKWLVELAGTQKLQWIPSAQETRLAVGGNWPHLSYGGSLLPSTQESDEGGFSAQWRSHGLASGGAKIGDAPTAACLRSNARAEYDASEEPCPGFSAFGFSLIDPVDHYTLSDRATKYGLMFVVLTFAAVMLFEVLRQLRVHPVQYALVGLALSIFFLLLISLSEHIAFERAYAVAAAACVALLVVYAQAVLKGWGRAFGFGLIVSALYGCMFVLLRLEQMALLAGSGLLFGVLAVLMIATRRVDWYAFQAIPSDAPKATATTAT
jgi:inner membrane protein